MTLRSLQRFLFASFIGCATLGYVNVSCAQEGILPAKEVSVESTYLNNLFLHQWVKLDPAGRLVGNVVALEPGTKVSMMGVRVHLVVNEQVVHTAQTDEDGEFVIPGVHHGTYALVVNQQATVGAFLLHVFAPEAGDHLPADVEVRVITALEASKIIRQQSVPGVGSDYPVLETDPLAESRSFHSGPVVFLKDGSFSGKLGTPGKAQDLSGMMVFVLKDGREIARASANSMGEFSLTGLGAGVYGLLAAGDAGMAATSFELAVTPAARASGDRLIAIQNSDSLAIELVPCNAVTAVEEIAVLDSVACNEVPVGPCGCGTPMVGFGGGGGFGGAGFGGGGWAGLAGIGGLIAAVAIIASDDDPKPVSPIVP
jgi:hypothetical protein